MESALTNIDVQSTIAALQQLPNLSQQKLLTTTTTTTTIHSITTPPTKPLTYNHQKPLPVILTLAPLMGKQHEDT
jgi:hypothetical protein